MALFPCYMGQHRYRGPACHFYPAVVLGGRANRQHQRVCPDHLEQLLDTLSAYEIETDEATTTWTEMTFLCWSCGKPVEQDPAQIFVTAYPRNEERRDFWLQCHAACAIPPWAPGRPLTETLGEAS
jgi:hypothetical protein